MSGKTAEDILESGIDIPDSAEEIEALLAGATTDDDEPAPDSAAEEADPPEDDATDDTPEPDPKDGEAEPEPEPEGDKPGPHPAVLRGYREKLHKVTGELAERDTAYQEQQRKNAELESELAELKAKIGDGQDQIQSKVDQIAGDQTVDVSTLDEEKLAELRTVLDDEAVDALAALSTGFKQLNERFQAVEQENQQLKSQRESEARQQYVDRIDAVPILGVLRNQGSDEQWDRAKAYLQAVRTDPDYADSSEDEVLAEVGKRMERFLGPEAVQGLLKDTGQSPRQGIEDAKAAADRKAVPTSLSEIPAAGEHVAQTELERAEAMSTDDVQSLMDKALAAGQDVDEVIARLMTG